MPVDYDVFRTKTWNERLKLFNAISAQERAELVRTHILHWLISHRQQVDRGQIEIVEEWIALVVPELYVRPRNEDLFSRMKDLQTRTARVLSRDQMREALTMHWDQSCRITTKE